MIDDDVRIIMNLINTEISSIEDRIREMGNTQESIKQINTLYNYRTALEKINNKIYRTFEFTNENPIMDTLAQNYGKHDTELMFMDETKYTVKKDDISSIKDNYLLIYNKEEFKKDKKTLVDKVLNLNNVLWLETLRSE